MPIEAQCPGCTKRYRLKDEQAGRRVKCPQCGAAIEIPAAQSTTQAAPPHRSGAATEMWYLYTATGEQYGPVPKAELDSWVADGSVDAECQVLKEGDADWRWASEVYPELVEYSVAGADKTTPPSFGGEGGYQSLLTHKGQVASIVNMMVNGEIKKSQFGLRVAHSAVYQVGEMRSWWEQAKHSATFGPFAQTKDIHVDYLNTFRLAAPRGDFHVVVPMDGALPCPVEFVSVVPGRLPTSIALLRGAGGNWGVDVENSLGGAFIPQPLTALMKSVGGNAQSAWITSAGQLEHPLVAAAERQAALKDGFRWDGQITVGQTRITYRLAWGVQAMPWGEQQFLLVAKNVPKNRLLLGLDLHLDWFVRLRDGLGQIAANNQAPGDGQFRAFDPGNWYAYAVEVMGLRL